jgi:16S rRNA (guanine527-N7)-methyltransferase
MDQQSVPDLPAALAQDRAQAIALNQDSVSRETSARIWARLDAFVALVLERQQVMNLIAPSTIPKIWTRHVADSLQLLRLAPNARRWIDLGSGAGFPGLVIACALADTNGAAVHLVESTQKKAAFLRDCAEALKLPAIVHAARIEDFTRQNSIKFEAVTARALASLEKLVALANPLLKTGAVGLFPKGQDVEAELTTASKSWKIEAELVQSQTDPHARIVRVLRAVKS